LARTAGHQEDRIGQLHDREAAKVLHVYDMADHAQECELDGKAVDDTEQDLDGDDNVDEARKQSLGEDGMFLDQL
jgi:hypothetical protein